MKPYYFILIAFVFICPTNSYSQVQSIAGTWQFRFDSLTLFSSIEMPGSCEERGFGTPAIIKDPMRLTRAVRFVGKAWYKKEIVVPDAWQGKRIELFLERCMWETAVWIDDKPVGTRNSLSTPHLYDLGQPKPGRHTILISIDNTIKLPIGEWGFAITDDTQGNWNGVIGRMELRATDPVWIESVQVFADHLNISVGNITRQKQAVELQGKPVAIAAGGAIIKIPFTSNAPVWDEFAPAMQVLEIALKSKKYSDRKFIPYGIRNLTTKNGQFLVNGRATLMRGPNNECVYPATQYPPMDKESWLRLFGICQSYGFNFMRFNSWCPPEAAFQAANELGYFLQIEIPFWSIFTDEYGKNAKRDQFLEDELVRILTAYGNNPSFAFMAMGNESPGPMDRLVKKGKSIDTRMLYRCQDGDTSTKGDFAERGTEIGMRGIKGGATNWDRWTLLATKEVAHYRDLALPTMAHEVGQWASYPDYELLTKFTGNLRPYNYENYRNSLAQHQMADLNKSFAMASGKFAVSLYKEEIEASLRTWPLGGFGIVEARDFTGEGTASIGWLDAFWDSKGFITPTEFRRFCSPTVCLLRMPKRVYTNAELFRAKAEIAHYAAHDMLSDCSWSIANDQGKIIASGNLGTQKIVTGKLNAIGEISASLKEVESPARLTVTLQGAGTSNSWNIWVYPPAQPHEPDQVIIAHAFNAATKQALEEGRNVLLFSSPKNGLFEIKSAFLGNDDVRLFPPVTQGKSAIPGSFMPAFWSMRLFNQIGTLGILCDPKHPALKDFPTEVQTDWQWADLLGRFTAQSSYGIAGDDAQHDWNDKFDRSKAIILNETPADFRPIVQMIDNYERNYKLGVIFETKVGKGKLLICAMDLETDAKNRPAAQQLKSSLLRYAAGDQFRPSHELSLDLLERILTY